MTNHGRPYRRRLLLVAAFALGAGKPAAAGAQSAAPPPSIQAAMQHMYGGDPRGAATILEALTKADPRNVRAWSLLALSYRQSGDLERARATYDKALALNPKSADAMFNLAGVWALEGKNDSAFAWLAKAKASRNYDMTQLEVDTAYASLRHDPRYASMLPTAKDFADPFVEHATIIREFDGDSTGDQFGWIARSLGDVDHDGMEDFVTSAPTKAIGGENAGRVYVYSSGTGMLLWSADGTPASQLGTGV